MNLHDRDIKKAAKEEGRNEKAVEAAINLLKMNILTTEQIAHVQGLSLEQILELQKTISEEEKS